MSVAPSEHVQRVQRPAMIGKVVGTGDAAGGCAHAGDWGRKCRFSGHRGGGGLEVAEE